MTALREAEIANIPFVAALPGALRRCSSLVWLATRRSERLALHPASAPKNGILVISASLSTSGNAPWSPTQSPAPCAHRIARQTRALGDFMQRHLVAQIHPSNSSQHFHGDHLVCPLPKNWAEQAKHLGQFWIGTMASSGSVFGRRQHIYLLAVTFNYGAVAHSGKDLHPANSTHSRACTKPLAVAATATAHRIRGWRVGIDKRCEQVHLSPFGWPFPVGKLQALVCCR